MRRLKLLALLAGGNVVVGVSIAVLCLEQINLGREAARHNAAMADNAQNRRALELLAGQSLEFARKNPALTAELGKLGISMTADARNNR